MELKELLLLNKLGFGVLSLTGSLVAVLGLVLYANVSSSNPYPELAEQAEVASNRIPASVPDVTTAMSKVEDIHPVVELKKEIRTFDVDCSGRVTQAKGGAVKGSIVVAVEQIRLRRANCGDDLSKSQIVNSSNGYVATLFQTNSSQLSTDYINLAEGENLIRLSFQDRLGAPHTSEISFSRSLTK